MIKVESLLYKIDQRLNKLSTNAGQQIPVEDKILAIREGEIQLIKSKVNPNNPLKQGLDGGRKRYQDLEFLIEAPEDHDLIPRLSDRNLNRWVVDIGDLTPKLLFFIDGYITANKGRCLGRVITLNPDLIAHGSVNTLLNNSNYKPSFEYQETFCEITHNQLGFYTDGTFTPKKLYLSYMRYPRLTDAEGYEDFSGKASTNVDSELPDYLEDELLDIVTASLAQYTENLSQLQVNSQRSASNE